MTISVCSISYNHEKYLDQYHQGIISQLDEDGKVLGHELEVNIVVDCSPDNSYEKLKSYDWKGINLNLINHEVNIGGPATFTECLKLATGEYVSMIECDDFYKPWKLKLSIQDLMENDIAATSTEISAIVGDTWIERGWANIGLTPKSRISINDLRNRNCIYTCTFVTRKEIIRECPSPKEFESIGGFIGDYMLFSYIATHFGEIGYQDEPLSVFREGSGVNSDRAKSIFYDGRIREWIARGCKRSDL